MTCVLLQTLYKCLLLIIMVICQSSEEFTYHIMVNKEPTNELTTFASALIHTIGSYDIAYPKPLKSLRLMIQHFVFELKDSQKDTSPIVEIVSSLMNMD